MTVTLADGTKDAETGFVRLSGCLPRPGWKRLRRHIQYQPWDGRADTALDSGSRRCRRSMSEPSVNYLRGFGDLLWTEAQQATSAVGDDFQRGRALGLYGAVSLAQQQALAFGLSSADIGLDGRDAEHLLNQR